VSEIELLDVLVGVFATVQACAKQMVKQGTGGSIITIASTASHQAYGTQNISAYVSSKFSVRGMTMQIARELAPYKIRVNSISQGSIKSKMTEQLASITPGLYDDTWAQGVMLKRLGEPDELNGLAVYLMSNLSSFVTGEDILVDGGFSHQGNG